MTGIEHTFVRKVVSNTHWQATCSCGWQAPRTGAARAVEDHWLVLHIQALGVVGNWGGR